MISREPTLARLAHAQSLLLDPYGLTPAHLQRALAEIMVRGDGHDPEAPMGSWASHLCLGPGWSTTCNTPWTARPTAVP